MSYTGNYDGPLCPTKGASCFPNIGQAVTTANVGGKTTVVAGVDAAKAAAAAKAADQVLLVIDNFHDGGGEGHDRTTIALSTEQITLCGAVLRANKNVAIVMIDGGLISLDDLAAADVGIINAGMPGVHGGTAVAQTIYGDSNPGGKLPATMYPSSYINDVNFLNMSMVAGPGRSYKYYTGKPTFPFGYGLSYTTFTMTWASPPPSGSAATVTSSRSGALGPFKCTVKNTGKVAGDEVVLAFSTPKAHTLRASLGDGVPIAKKSLFGFQRVHLEPGASTTVTFTLEAADLAMVDAEGHSALHRGEFAVELSRGHGATLQAPVRVEPEGGRAETLKTFRKWW